MPTQIQYYNSSAAMTGILQPQTSECGIQTIRAVDPYPINAVAFIRPVTGFQFRNISPPRNKPVWNDPRKKSEQWTGSLIKYRVMLNHRSTVSALSRKAPFAARTFGSDSKYKDGRMGKFPQYNSLSDPHLFNYYVKKFGVQKQLHSLSRSKSSLLPRPLSSRRVPSRTASLDDGDVLYKVTVQTGEKREAGTDAKVFLQMKGSKGKMNKKRLWKNSVSKKSDGLKAFRFNKGSSHMFKLYGPDIGELQNIILEHDGLEKRQAWYIEHVSITNTTWNKSWNIPCRTWLSLFHTDCQLSRTFCPATGRRNEYTGAYFPDFEHCEVCGMRPFVENACQKSKNNELEKPIKRFTTAMQFAVGNFTRVFPITADKRHLCMKGIDDRSNVVYPSPVTPQ